MMKTLFATALSLACIASRADAQSVYKCTVNGVTNFSQDPCPKKTPQSCRDANGKWTAGTCPAPTPPTSQGPNPFDWRPIVGMTEEEVDRAVVEAVYVCDKMHGMGDGMAAFDAKYPSYYKSWLGCLPPTENKTTTAHGVHIQIIFKGDHRYAYLDNGVVTAIQE